MGSAEAKFCETFGGADSARLDPLSKPVLDFLRRKGEKMSPRSLIPISAKEKVKLEALQKFVPIPRGLKRNGLAFPKKFKAAVVIDSKNSPQLLVFDAKSFWDLICVFDERFERSASTEEYVRQNPFGWLIDALESRFPPNRKLAEKLRRGFREAERLGRVSFRRIKEKLDLN